MKFLKTLINMILIIEIVLIAFIVIPKLFNLQVYVVTSGSMEPKYPTGSIIYVKKVDPNDIKPGDTITFYLNESTIIATHEVYEIDKDNYEFRTQGINNKDENGNIIHDATPVKYSSLIGKPVLCIKKLGYASNFITSPLGKTILISLTIFIILINLILEKFKVEVNYEKKHKKK